MKTDALKALAFTSLCMLLVISCRKQVTETVTADAQVAVAASDDVEADATFTDVSNDVSGVNDDIGIAITEVGDDIQPGDPISAKCYTVTIDPLTPGVFPKTVTIDFGTGCLCKDGKTRKGQIITVFTGRLRVPGSKATTTFNGYYVNDVHVEGTHIIENNSTADIHRFTRTVVNGKLSKPGGNYIVWNGTHTSTQTTGLGTPNYYWDDEFDITGNASGESSRNGFTVTWTRSITEALHKKANCRWFDKGIITLSHNNHTATLDFGNGTCDNKATVAINGITKEITLP